MISHLLREREAEGRPIRVGVIGAGTFGTQIIAQTCRMQGVRISAIAELNLERAREALRLGGADVSRATETDTESGINDAIRGGQPVLTTSVDALVQSELDVVIEATGNVEAGSMHAFKAIEARKHVVMVTVEADVVVGHILKEKADAAGVLYSMAYGDEPALAYELWDWARTLGFRVVAAGKGTRFLPSFRKFNPDDVPGKYGFAGEDYNAQMFGSFLDGTKHAIEMTALSNATGLVPDVRGMHFAGVDLRELPDVMCTKEKGGILNEEGVVEAISAICPDETPVERNLRGGLYAVIDSPEGFCIDSLESYGEIIGMFVGKKSRYAVIYRPQHFIGHEMPMTVARMMTTGLTCGSPTVKTSDVVASAKKPLHLGDVLDGEGGYAVYGLIEKTTVAREEKLVPMGLTQGAKVLTEIPEDGMITYDNVEVADSFAYRLLKEYESNQVFLRNS
jgi:predicted homoserine dehydrogenase-like protein